jgi:hypothetical protein
MIVREARGIARQWVEEEGHELPGFLGAFYHGSINWLSEDAALAATSDVDIMVAVTNPCPPNKIGKFWYRDVLLEVSCVSEDQILSPEQILSNYHLAGSFRTPGIISDPTGQLTGLQAVISRDYAKRFWVRKRCEHAESNVYRCLQSLDESAPLHQQVTAWLFATGITTHMLLVAGLKNPTVRKRYVAVHELLREYGIPHFHETLLEMLGCARMKRGQTEQHLAALSEAFDDASAVLKTPYPFAADFGETGRPVAINGSRELIDVGCHRETVFWMLATYSRCQWVLIHDAPAPMQEKHRHGYQSLLADVGISSFADIQKRCAEVGQSLPQIWEVAETIMGANELIIDEPF